MFVMNLVLPDLTLSLSYQMLHITFSLFDNYHFESPMGSCT